MSGTEDKVRLAGLKFNRGVARVIMPGTQTDEKFMDPTQNNFILAIYMDIFSLETQVEGQGNEDSAN